MDPVGLLDYVLMFDEKMGDGLVMEIGFGCRYTRQAYLPEVNIYFLAWIGFFACLFTLGWAGAVFIGKLISIMLVDEVTSH